MPKKSNIAGTRFSHLVAVEPTAERKNGYTVWRCLCDCGRVTYVPSRYLKNGWATTCEDFDCEYRQENLKMHRCSEDLTGQRFGKLVVTGPVLEQDQELTETSDSKLTSAQDHEPSEKSKTNRLSTERSKRPHMQKRDDCGRILWNCVCDCGRTIIAPTGQLKAGYRRSCGCLSRPPLKNWVGKRFGILTVTEYDGKRSGKHWWKCKCDCGNEAIVCQSNLMSGHTISCGCMNKPFENRTIVDGTCVETLRGAVEKKTISRNNTSGIRGVYQNKRTGRWCAQITFKGKTKFLGSFETIREAQLARERGEEKYFIEFLEEYDTTHGIYEAVGPRNTTSRENNAELSGIPEDIAVNA